MSTLRAAWPLLVTFACTTPRPDAAAEDPRLRDATSPLRFDAPSDQEPDLPKPEVASVSAEITASLVESLNAFNVDVYRRAATGDANVVLSPASIAIALAMVHAGSAGATQEEIADALHLRGSPAEIEGAFASVVRTFNAPGEGIELAVVDRVFGDATVPFEPSYLARVDAVFGAPLEKVDFKRQPDAARTRINAWVTEQTRDRIRDLLVPGAVDSDTRLVLVNAIYFKAQWTEPFGEYATRDGDFFGPHGTKTAKMMGRTDFLAYAAHPEDGVSVLALPYAHGQMKMIVILPDAKNGLAAVEQKLDAALLAKWTSVSNHARVEVKLPRFRIEMPEPLRLRGILESLGIRRAFDHTQADFSPMAPADEKLQISEGFHKAFIAVDEKGTEAAAATALGMIAGAAPPKDEPKRFIADHPFLFAIRDGSTGAILFLGRVTDPS